MKLCVKINNLNISEVTEKSIDLAQRWFSELEKVLTEKENKIAQHILKEINEKIKLSSQCWIKLFNIVKRGQPHYLVGKHKE